MQDDFKLNPKIKELEDRISKLETDLINVLAQQKMIRDKVLKRFRGDIKPSDAENTETNINSNPFMG